MTRVDEYWGRRAKIEEIVDKTQWIQKKKMK
jgi:hypothetical protein